MSKESIFNLLAYFCESSSFFCTRQDRTMRTRNKKKRYAEPCEEIENTLLIDRMSVNPTIALILSRLRAITDPVHSLDRSIECCFGITSRREGSEGGERDCLYDPDGRTPDGSSTRLRACSFICAVVGCSAKTAVGRANGGREVAWDRHRQQPPPI